MDVVKDKKIIYLSGPMTGLPKNNYPAFREAEKILKRRGFVILNPAHTIANGSYADYLRRDIQMLLLADCVVALAGWKKSVGAKLEVDIAKKIGLEFVEFEKWV